MQDDPQPKKLGQQISPLLHCGGHSSHGAFGSGGNLGGRGIISKHLGSTGLLLTVNTTMSFCWKCKNLNAFICTLSRNMTSFSQSENIIVLFIGLGLGWG